MSELGTAPVVSSTVLLAGNPNCGKTTVFNGLSGQRAKVGNYPGVTVDRRSAKLPLPSGRVAEVVDLPGTYSLTARSAEEEVAARAVLGRLGAPPDAVVVIVSATSLARGLYVVLQVLETGVPVVVGLNMMDEARSEGIAIDRGVIAEALGVEVVPLVATREEGRAELVAAVDRALGPRTESADGFEDTPSWVGDLLEHLPDDMAGRTVQARIAYAHWAMISLGDDELDDVPESLRTTLARLMRDAEAEGRDPARELIESRYARVDGLLARAVERIRPARRSLTERVDSILVHPVWGLLVFVAVMAIVFQALFAGADPLIAGIELGVASLQDALSSSIPPGPVQGLLVDGVVAGVGNVIVFVPQLALLFLLIGVLEDSGYLARVAFVIDRLMGGIGLHGKAFVPMLSGFACAVPAVLATRTIESRRDRLLTMMVIPLTSCSARLPVYVLVTAAIFSSHEALLGPLSTGAVVLLGLYLLSIGAALAAAAVLRRTVLKGPRPTLVLELPPYRMPTLRNLLRSTWARVRVFLVDAGTIILAMTIVLWGLLSYPQSDAIEARYTQLRDDVPVAAADRGAQLDALAQEQAAAELEYSAAGRVGKAMEPALSTFGQDWRIGVAILGSFAAREVFVGTLGIVFGLGDADEESEPLRDHLRTATRDDGRPLMTPLSGLALLVFFVLACQCMSTLAVVKREAGGWKWAIFLFGYMSLLAYGAAVCVYQIGRALGYT